MERRIFDIDVDSCAVKARQIFSGMIEMNSVGRSRRKAGKRLTETIREARGDAWEMVRKRAFIRGAWVRLDLDEMSIDGNKLVVDCGEDIDICCEAFGLLDTETVRGVILYAVTVGDVLSEEGSALQRVFEDMWGTALTDSARILLRERFLEDTNLSDSFGPGYYGMRPEEMRKIGGLLDIGELGIEIRETGMMVPD